VSERRCWETSDQLYLDYHDHEWGRPVTDETGLLERLCLEGFQSGLSWLTILRKREAFRSAFANFDADTVAKFDEDDVERLLADASIVRHRGKIEAAISNARATVELRASGTTLPQLVWAKRAEDKPAPRGQAEWQAATPESIALSKELKEHGFRFVGPTTVYSTMQACGVVNDHFYDCIVREDVEDERARVRLR
jgi:DNA-3-methyladenine glycosylase I